MSDATWLSLILFLPCGGALALLATPPAWVQAQRWTTLGVTAAVLALVLALPISGRFAAGSAGPQNVVMVDWVPLFRVQYFLALDGLSWPLLAVTALTAFLAAAASWTIQGNVRVYSILFLLLTTGMLGVFLALDFFLFYVFFELVLLPMYFLVGLWGGPRKEYAALKFFLYTLAGSVLILVAMLILYFGGDLRQLSAPQAAAALIPSEAQVSIAREAQPVRTMNLLAMAQIGQHTRLYENPELLFLGKNLQWWAFVLLAVGFLIKVPSVPFHTWLPDAHVEAPTPISMILAGVLLKIGGYGLMRIAYPICPAAAQELAWLMCGAGLLSLLYGAFAALAQTDFKRLVAYSSVSHMGYVVLGVAIWGAYSGNDFDSRSWALGMNGALYQMVAHGILSPGMFFLVGAVYERLHHRDLGRMGGLAAKMPSFSTAAAVIFFGALGLPTLAGFVGEVFVLFSLWEKWPLLALLTASATVVTAGYILWTLQRTLLGLPSADVEEHVHSDLDLRERLTIAPLVVLAVLLGCFPQLLLRYSEATATAQTRALAEWSKARAALVPPPALANDRPAPARDGQPGRAPS